MPTDDGDVGCDVWREADMRFAWWLVEVVELLSLGAVV